jgi:hypothetical protein
MSSSFKESTEIAVRSQIKKKKPSLAKEITLFKNARFD